MCISKLAVGLDYHQDQVQVCVLDENGKVLMNRSLSNHAKAIHGTVEDYGEATAVAIEACCGAANLADELNALGWNVSLAHPGFVWRMKQNPDKTDFSDSRLLADLVRVGYLPKVWLAPEELRRLRRLVRYRQQLVDQRRDVKLRIRALLRDNRIRPPQGCNAWTKRWLTWLSLECPLTAEDAWMMNRHLSSLQRLREEINEVEKKLLERASGDAATPTSNSQTDQLLFGMLRQPLGGRRCVADIQRVAFAKLLVCFSRGAVLFHHSFAWQAAVQAVNCAGKLHGTGCDRQHDLADIASGNRAGNDDVVGYVHELTVQHIRKPHQATLDIHCANVLLVKGSQQCQQSAQRLAVSRPAINAARHLEIGIRLIYFCKRISP